MIPPAAAIESVGSGPELVVVHGTATGRLSWAPLARLLRERLRITCYDRRGTAGWSAPGEHPPVSAAEHARDLADLLVARGGRPVHLFGASFGGAIVLELVRRRPELVDRAILFEPATDGREEVPLAVKTVLGHFEHWLARGRPEQAAESFHRRMLSETVWERMPAAARAQACGGWRHIHSDLRATADYRISPTALRELKTPFLLLRGARSSPAFEAPLRGLARALPRARVEVLESAGHQIAGAGWRETADAVAGFLDA